MPELPELEIVKEFLQQHAVGKKIEYAEIPRPLVLRNLTSYDSPAYLIGKTINAAQRRGKFLLFSLDSQTHLVINPMLSGRLYWASPQDKKAADTFLILGLSGKEEIRYVDPKTMGKIYLTEHLNLVPGFDGQGPESLEISEEEFRQRLRKFRGEIKGILTDQAFLAGIGNAYADEILHRARIYPFIRRSRLSPEEISRLYSSMRLVLEEAMERVRAQMGAEIHLKFREELAVHGKGGEPCPRCGTPISEIKARNRITNFCRNCQPGIMLGRSRRLGDAR